MAERIRVLRSEAISSILSDGGRLLKLDEQSSNGNIEQKSNNGLSARYQELPSSVQIGRWNTLQSLLLVNSLGSLALIRVPWMVGRVGLILTIFIILVCCITSLLTIMSINRCGNFNGGNVNICFQLHKYLGPYFGISIGLIFYLGQSMAVALYALAAAEVLAWSPKNDSTTAPNLHFEQQVFSLVLCVTVTIFLAFKTYRFIRILSITTCVILSLTYLSVIAGIIIHQSRDLNTQIKNYTGGKETITNFSHVFSVYLTLTSVSFTQMSSPVLPINISNFRESAIIALVSIAAICIVIATLISNFIGHDYLISQDLIVVIVAWPWQRFVQAALIIGCCLSALHRLMNASRLLSAISYKGGWYGIKGNDNSYVLFLKIRRLFSRRLADEEFAAVASEMDLESPNDGVYNSVPTSNSPSEKNAIEVNGDQLPLNFYALIMTWLIASVPCLSGNLNNLTVIISCCYLFTFIFVNLIAYLKSRNKGSSMSYQSIHNSNHYLLQMYYASETKLHSFGAFLCFVLAMIISWWITLIFALVIGAFIYYLCHYGAPPAKDPVLSGNNNLLLQNQWGEALEGLMDELASRSRQSLNMSHYFTRRNITDWRPRHLVLLPQFPLEDDTETINFNDCPNSTTNESIIRLACQMKRPSEIVNVLILTTEDILNLSTPLSGRSRSSTNTTTLSPPTRNNHLPTIDSILQNHGYIKTVSVNDLSSSVCDVALNIFGDGDSGPNSVVMAWPVDWESQSTEMLEQYCDWYKATLKSKKTLIVVKGNIFSDCTKLSSQIRISSNENSSKLKSGNTIDVWWTVHDGGLLLLLPTLLQLYGDSDWKDLTMRLFVVMTKLSDNPVQLRNRTCIFLKKVGIDAEVEVIDLSAQVGEASWVYEQTISLPNRLAYLTRLAQANASTMTLALQDHDEHIRSHPLYGESNLENNNSSSRVPHIADIFQLQTNNNTTQSPNIYDNQQTYQSNKYRLTHNSSDVDYSNVYSARRTNSLESEPNLRPGVLATLFTPDTQTVLKGTYQQNPMTTNQDSWRANHRGANRISASALSNAAVPLNEKILHEEENVDIALKGEANRICGKFHADPKRIQLAVKFNYLLRSQSKDAKLIVTNFPMLRRLGNIDIMAYVGALTKEIDKIILVRGCGQEVVTTYS